jgi:hypothetical protein
VFLSESGRQRCFSQSLHAKWQSNQCSFILILDHLWALIKHKFPRLLSTCVLLLHDDVRPHCVTSTQQLLHHRCWKIFEHPTYSPDLEWSHYHMFLTLIQIFGNHKFQDNHQVQTAFTQQLITQGTGAYQHRTGKLSSRNNECLSCSWDYAGK